MNVPRNFLETIPRSLPPSCPSVLRLRRKFHRILCCALQFYRGFQYPATKPRSRNPTPNLSRLFRFNLLQNALLFTPHSSSQPYPLAPASSTCFLQPSPQGRHPPLVPSKTTCGNLVASSDHKGPPGRKYLNSNTFLLRGALALASTPSF